MVIQDLIGGPKIALFEPVGEFAIFLIFAPLFIKEKWKGITIFQFIQAMQR
jgi:hypothetical protein